jgi:formiminoglutamase
MFKPTEKSLFFKSRDKNDLRIGDWTQSQSQKKLPFSLIGYPDDEGIQINLGRTGAKEAPDKIRQYLYKMTPSCPILKDFLNDLGNLSSNDSLEKRHEIAAQEVESRLKKGEKVISLGGGHDYGFADGMAFLNIFGDQNPIVINVDAHLDVRTTEFGLSSGTPFFRLKQKHPDFCFYELGIQDQCNSIIHKEWAKENGIKILSFEEIVSSGKKPITEILDFLSDDILKKRPCFLSIDLDAFSSAYAPGCSQSWATGFEPSDILMLIEILCNRLDIKNLGLYEVSPRLDIDDRTSRLAALLAHRFLMTELQ